MSLADVTSAMRERIGDASGLDATVKFDFGADGCLYLDGTPQPYAVPNEDEAAACIVSMSLDDFKEMATGELDPTTAFMMGKLKVTGDMGVAMKLAAVLG
ncbi:MAG: SCP2 sterol-binding domain-containing protein [Rhodospirillaceae bacterium]|nr:SCP2 sterol-binding domain-containing protein [Rhodospirillaceae bacterium]